MKNKLEEYRYNYNESKRPKSFDSMYINNNDVYCIEFKNEKSPNKKNIEQKLIDGKRELDEMLIFFTKQFRKKIEEDLKCE